MVCLSILITGQPDNTGEYIIDAALQQNRDHPHLIDIHFIHKLQPGIIASSSHFLDSVLWRQKVCKKKVVERKQKEIK